MPRISKMVFTFFMYILSLISGRAFSQPNNAVLRNPHFGVCTHFAQGWDYKQILPLIAACGVTWVRDDLHWDEIETKKGQYVITDSTMNWIKAVHSYGLKLLLILNRRNKIYDNPYDPVAFAAFSARMAKSLGNHVDAFEILNEPSNFGFSQQYGGEWNGVEKDDSVSNWVKKHVQLTNLAAEAIKKEAPHLKVIGLGSFAPVNFRELQMGISRDVDAIADHPYSFKLLPEFVPYANIPAVIQRDGIITADANGTFFSQVRLYRKQSGDNDGPKELWNTEFGFSDFAPDVPTLFSGLTEKAQAKYLLRRLTECLAMEVDVAIIYDFKNDGVKPGFEEHNFGLVDFNLNPKFSYGAVRYLAAETEGLTPVQDTFTKFFFKQTWLAHPLIQFIDTPAARNTRTYAFRNRNDETVIAIWEVRSVNEDKPGDMLDINISTLKQYRSVTVSDLMTGKKNSIGFSAMENGIAIKNFQLTDYPKFITLHHE